MMTQRISAGVCSLLLVGASIAEDKTVLAIRKEYQSIQSALPSLLAESVDLPGYSLEGGEAKAFRDSKGNIRLVRVELFGETYKALEEFYYENATLIFVISIQYRYNVPFYITPERAKEEGIEAFDSLKSTATENRYYFHNEKLIQWLDKKGNPVNSNSKEFKDAEKSYLNTSKKMRSQFK